MAKTRERPGHMIFTNLLILFVAAILGGTLNSVAGGGSFIGFPALISVNVPPIQANTTNTVALWPGSVAAAWALRKELVRQNKLLLLALIGASLLGGIAGAQLLIHTSQSTFLRLIPFLLLMATLLFAFSPLINARLKQRAAEKRKEGSSTSISLVALIRTAALQLVIAVYGGYFGGGIGILMLASLGIMGMEDIHEMNAVKNTLAACINGVAVVIFIFFKAIVWPDALVMIVGAILGGFGGGYYARKIDARIVRGFVILVGTLLTLAFFFSWPPILFHKH